MIPVMIELTTARNGNKIFVNANHIAEVMEVHGEDTDDFAPAADGSSTLLFLDSRPAIRVKETPEQIAVEIKYATIDQVTDIANRLNAMGFIH